MEFTIKENETNAEYLKRLDVEFKKSPDIKFWMIVLYNSKLKDRIEFILELIDNCSIDDIILGRIKGEKLNLIDSQIVNFIFDANQIIISDKLNDNGSQFIIDYVYNKLKK